jgi:hypothetical protein
MAEVIFLGGKKVYPREKTRMLMPAIIERIDRASFLYLIRNSWYS